MKRLRLLGLAGVFLLMLALLPLVWFSPPPEHEDFGSYRVVKVGGLRSTLPGIYLLFQETVTGHLCSARQEIYSEGRHLGTCETPNGLMIGTPQPIPDPFCFAIAPDRSSAVYWHEAKVCGETAAPAKAPGIYMHSLKGGERLLYPGGDGLVQLWGGEPAANGIAVGLAYPKGRRVVGFDGRERVEIRTGTGGAGVR
ncbi:MAG TPA: hypothetical protein VI485_08040 [Vicinamibacterales bacterium]|nr:hypothetical protein [Vicinamibacterales bacterium]